MQGIWKSNSLNPFASTALTSGISIWALARLPELTNPFPGRPSVLQTTPRFTHLTNEPLYPPFFRSIFFLFFNDTATTEIFTLSLHYALPFFLKEHTPQLLSLLPLVCRLLL